MFYSVFSRKPVVYNGALAVGARVEFFDAGTNTARTMYSDGLLTTELDPLDIKTDANGAFPDIYGQGGAYKAVVYAPGGSVLYTSDNIPGDVTSGGGGGGGGGSSSHVTGDVQASILSGTRTGWVRANGRTIGSAASGATELADATAENLFLGLWANTLFSVSGGRGASAAADWSANKTITLPALQGRTLAGVDSMGGSTLNILSGVTFTTGNASSVGSTVGTSTHSLTSAQTGPHVHGATTSTAGNHQHGGTTYAVGDHTHVGSTDGVGDHTHSQSVPTNSALGGTQPSFVFANTLGATSTGAAGAHSHTFTTAPAGTHSHGFLSDAAGAHSHTLTTDLAGLGEAHPNVQPSVLVTYYIKL